MKCTGLYLFLAFASFFILGCGETDSETKEALTDIDVAADVVTKPKLDGSTLNSCADIQCGDLGECKEGACVCIKGYSANANNQCEDVDECLTENGGCGDATLVNCINTKGAFKCTDINECLTDNGGCGPEEICTNNDAAKPSCACQPGFEYNDKDVCVVTAACQAVTCDSTQYCDEGKCVCQPGFESDGADSCVDVDECAKDNGGCGDPALFKCTNTPGSVLCADVDECATDNGGCDPNAICINNEGAVPTCQCKPGYQVNADKTCVKTAQCANVECSENSHCEGNGVCVCDDGFEDDGTDGCQDIDECQTDNGGCHKYADCKNTDGSFQCVCKAFYEANGTVCTDINECLIQNGGCDANATCINNPGASPTCNCNAFYIGDGVACVDVDECASDNGGCDSNASCTNNIGKAVTCTCTDFYEGDGLTCTDVDECQTDNGGCHEFEGCTNNVGGAATCIPAIAGPVIGQLKVDSDASGDSYNVNLSGEVVSGPFTFEATGTAQKSGKDEAPTWCLTGQTDVELSLFSLEGVTVKICDDGTKTLTGELSGTLKYENNTAPFTGSYDPNNEAWSMTINATKLTYLELSMDTFNFVFKTGDTSLAIEADYNGPHGLKLALNGTVEPDKDVTLNATLQAQQTWQPVAGLKSFLFTEVTGALTRVDGAVTGEIKGVSNSEMTFVDGLALGTSSLTATYATQQWTLNMSGETTLEPVGKVSLGSALVAEDEEICLKANTALTVGEAQVTASWCVDMGNPAGASLQAPEFNVVLTNELLGDIPLKGIYDAATKALCVSGHVNGDLKQWMAPPATTVMHVDVRSCYGDEGFASPSYRTILSTGNGATSTMVAAKGEYLAEGDLTFELTGAPGCADGGACANFKTGCTTACDYLWQPFAYMSNVSPELEKMVFSELKGTMTRKSGKWSIAASAPLKSGNALMPVMATSDKDIFSMSHLAVNLELLPEGLMSVALSGKAIVLLKVLQLTAEMKAEVADKNLYFEGSISAPVDAADLGFPVDETGAISLDLLQAEFPGVLVIKLKQAFATAALDFTKKETAFEFGTQAEFTFLKLFTSYPEVTVHHRFTATGTKLAAIARLNKLEISLWDGKLTMDNGDNANIITTFTPAGAIDVMYDLDGDPSTGVNGKEYTLEIKKGLELTAQAKIPGLAALIPDLENAEVKLVGRAANLSYFSLTGKIITDFELIKPEYNIPSIHRISTDELYLAITYGKSGKKGSGSGKSGSGDGSGSAGSGSGGNKGGSPSTKQKTVRVSLGGKMKIEAEAKDGTISELTSLAEIEVQKDKKFSAGGTLAVNGQWKNPFWIPKTMLINPGLSFRLLISKIPAPVALGFNGDVLVLMEEEIWPEKIEMDETNTPIIPQDYKSKMFAGGGTLFYDVMKSESGFCLGWKCLELPIILTRFNIEGLPLAKWLSVEKMVRDATYVVVDILKDIATSTTDVYKDLNLPGNYVDSLSVVTDYLLPQNATMPMDTILKPENDGSTIENKAQFYFSTHNFNRFGLDFSFGGKLDASLKLQVPGEVPKQAYLKGAMNSSGLQARGYLSGTTLNIPGAAKLAIVGDPYRQYAKMNNGAVVVADSSKFDSIQSIEGWVYLDEVSTEPSTHILVSKGEHLQLSVGGNVPSCDINTLPQIPENKLCTTVEQCGPQHTCTDKACVLLPECTAHGDCEAGEHCAEATGRCVKCPLKGGAWLKVQNSDGVKRSVTTQLGFIQPKTWHHVAANLYQDSKVIKLYVDGEERFIVDTATADDTTMILPASNNEPLAIGAGITRVDDVRFWVAPRDPVKLMGEARQLPRFFNYDSSALGSENPLIARYQFDRDSISEESDWFYDSDKEAYLAHNTRLYKTQSQSLHGHFLDGAVPEVATDDNPIDLRINVRTFMGIPIALEYGVQMGFELDLPGNLLDRKVAYGGDWSSALVSLGAANGKWYTRAFNAFVMDEIATFYISGNGPNNVPKDFDDGLYGDMELTASPFPEIQSSGRIYSIDDDGEQRDFLLGDLLLACDKADGCDSVDEYIFRVKGVANLNVGVPYVSIDGTKLALLVKGNGLFDTKEKLFELNGEMSIGGKSMNGGILISEQKIQVDGGLNLGTVAGVDFGFIENLKGTLEFSPFSVCASGNSSLTFPGLGDFKGPFDTCWGPTSSVAFESQLDSLDLGALRIKDVELSVNFNCASANCMEKDGLQFKGKVNVPNVYEGSVAGTYISEKEFSFTGSSSLGDWGMGNGFSASSDVTVSNAGTSAVLKLNVDNKNALISGELNGQISGDPNAVKYNFSGNCKVNLGELKVADAAVAFSSAEGLRVSFEQDVGFGNKATFTGEIKPGGEYLLNADVHYNIDGQATVKGTLTLSPQGMSMTATQNADLLGAKSKFEASYVLKNGVVDSVKFSSYGNIKLSGVELAAATVELDSKTGHFHIDANVNLPPFMQFAVSGGVENGQNFSLTGKVNTSMIPKVASYAADIQLVAEDGSVKLAHSGQLSLIGSSSTVSGDTSLLNGKIQSLELNSNTSAGMTLQGINLGHTGASATYKYTAGNPPTSTVTVNGRLDFGGIKMTGTIDSDGKYNLTGSLKKTFAVDGIGATESIPGARIAADVATGLVGCVTSVKGPVTNESICGCFAKSWNSCCSKVVGVCVGGLCGSCAVANTCFYCYLSGGTKGHTLSLGTATVDLSYKITNAGASANASASYNYSGLSLSASGSGTFSSKNICVNIDSGQIGKAAAKNLGIDASLLSVGSFSECIKL